MEFGMIEIRIRVCVCMLVFPSDRRDSEAENSPRFRDRIPSVPARRVEDFGNAGTDGAGRAINWIESSNG